MLKKLFSSTKCSVCNGKGEVQRTTDQVVAESELTSAQIALRALEGGRFYVVEMSTCPKCLGTGLKA